MRRNKKGFTLIEIIVAIVIIGILVTTAISINYTMTLKSMAQNTRNNLIIIAEAEENYFFNNGTYCVPNSPPSPINCDVGLTNINRNMSLNIPDNYYYIVGSGGGSRTITAFDPSSMSPLGSYSPNPNTVKFVLQFDKPLVLPGAPGCTANVTGTCNPQCISSADLCPN